MYRTFPAFLTLLLLCACFLLLPGNVSAGDDNYLARVLDGQYDDYTFRGYAGQVIFAEVLADYYQNEGRMGGDHEHETAETTEVTITGGCSGDDDGGCSDGGCTDDGGCSDDGSSGSVGLHLQLLKPEVDGTQTVICWAGRPNRPGWQRDPRLACALPENGEYVLRVFLCGQQCGSSQTYMNADAYEQFYFLKVKLMEAQTEGSVKFKDKF